MRKRLITILAAAAALGGFAAAAHAAPAHVATKIALPDGGWDLASFDPVMRRVYLARTDAVDAVDVDTGRVTTLTKANRSHAAIPVNMGTEVLVTDGGTDTARFIDARSGADVGALPVGKNPDAALFDEATGLALVMNAKSGDVTLIDTRTHAVVGSLTVGGSLELAASDGKGTVFLNVEDKNEMAVLDLKARSVKHVALKGCDGPTGIAYLPQSRRVLSACANGVAAITRADTLQVEKTLPIGQGPDTAMYDPVRHLALVPCGRSGELVSFADTARGVIAQGRTPTQRGARTGALDTKTGRAYLPTAEYLPAADPKARPTVKPGSVALLVVEP